MHSTLVIVNSRAAQGRTGRLLSEIREWFRDSADVAETTSSGHAEELAFEAIRTGTSTIIAAGGDGTIHEVVNGILRSGRQDVRLGLLPLGSGNDYAAACAVPRRWQDAGKLLKSAEFKAVDAGEVCDQNGRTRFFVNTLGLGLSGGVAIEARSIRRLRGVLKYGLATLKTVSRHLRVLETRLTIDGSTETVKTISLSVALGQREGGGFVVAPEAAIDDGWFGALHVADVNVLTVLRYLPGLICGIIPKHPGIRTFRCRTLRIESDLPLIIHTDGEMFSRNEDRVCRIEIRLLCNALRVCCGQRHNA